MAKKEPEKLIDLLQGVLDLLILKRVSLGALHGHGVLGIRLSTAWSTGASSPASGAGAKTIGKRSTTSSCATP